MSDEHDSWFKDAFGVDLGQAVQGIQDEASAAASQVASTVTQVVQGVQGVVEGGLDEVTGAVTGIVKKVAGAVSPSDGGGGGAGGGSSSGGTGSFPLGGSVGQGGKNAPNDVRAVQSALGIAVDGQCGGQTIAAIEAFQRSMGVAKPDGRVDAGGPTERALAGGGSAKRAAQPLAAPGADDEPSSLFDAAVEGAKGVAAGLLGLGEKVVDGLQDLGGDSETGNAAADVRADAGQAQSLVDRIVATIKARGDIGPFFHVLNNIDMRTLLDTMDRLKREGMLEAFADRTPTGMQRVGVAILTIRPEFDELWRKLVAGLNDADRQAVLERTPKRVQSSAGFAKPEGNEKDDPDASVEVDLHGVKVQAKLEFHSKAFGDIGTTEFAVKLGADGKLEEFEVDLSLIKQKLQKLGKLGPILDLEASLSLNAAAEIQEHDKKVVVEGVKAGVKAEIQVSFKGVPVLKKVILKLSATAGSGGFEIGGAIEIPIPGT